MNEIDNNYFEFNVLEPYSCSNFFQVYWNRYWWCVDGDPRRAVFYYGGENDKIIQPLIMYPQCHISEKTARHLLKNSALQNKEDISIVLIPMAFVPHKCERD
jgi:hypothetical protein